MTPGQLDDMLRAWGRAYGERPEIEFREDERAPDVHPLAVGMRFAPGNRTVAVERAVYRGGQQRRKLMAGEFLEACGIRMVPASFVDPVPAPGRGGGGSCEDNRMQPIVEAVQDAWMVLFRFNTLCANVVQAEYQRRGMTQGDKAATLGIKLRRYRDELDDGRLWLHGRLAA